MSISRYKKTLMPIILFYGIFFTILIINGLVIDAESMGFLLINPIESWGIDALLIFGIALVAGVIGALIGGYLLGPLFLIAQKKTIGRNMQYGIQDKERSKDFKGAYKKAFFPALLAINIALIFSTSKFVQSISITSTDNREIMRQMLTIAALIPLVSGIGIGLFAGVWILLDAGIVYTNKQSVEESSDPIEIRTVGGWYMYLLKGYAGISVIINYYLFFNTLVTNVEATGGGGAMILIAWPIMPLIIALYLLPGIIVLDMTFEKRREFMRKFAARHGISEPLEISVK